LLLRFCSCEYIPRIVIMLLLLLLLLMAVMV
jgi:hypothetical protein